MATLFVLPRDVALVTGLLTLAAVIYLLVRGVEVRLVLLGAGLLMATVAGNPLAISDTFTRAMVSPMVAPICVAMGFAAVLTATGCDRHLVRLLLAPVRRASWAMLPAGILAAYLVNMAIPSQTSTAATLGPILVPLLLAAGVERHVAGAALILGASFGGDLLNPGAQDVLNVSLATGLSARELGSRVRPAGIAGVVVAALVFAVLNRHRVSAEPLAPSFPEPVAEPPINLFKAAIPLVPIILLLLAYSLEPSLGDSSPMAWLLDAPAISVTAKPADVHEWQRLKDALPTTRALLIGVLLAVVVGWREMQPLTRRLFEGMGLAFANIISLTITALCFGRGLDELGVSRALLDMVGETPWAMPVLAVAFPWLLAVLSGSGSSPIQTFAVSLLAPMADHPEAVRYGTLAMLGGAFGRTSSPISAVVIYSSTLVGESPLLVVRRLLPALLAGAAVAISVVLL